MSDCSFTADIPTTKYTTISNQLQQPTPHKLIAFRIMGPLVQGYCSASRSGEAIPHMLNRCERFNVWKWNVAILSTLMELAHTQFRSNNKIWAIMIVENGRGATTLWGTWVGKQTSSLTHVTVLFFLTVFPPLYSWTSWRHMMRQLQCSFQVQTARL